MIRTSACNIFRLIESDRDTAGNALQWNVVGWWNPATSSADQNLARKGGSSVFLFGNMIGREEVQLSSQETLHCRVTKACNILWSKSGKEEILSLGSPATLFCTGTPLVISGNLPEIRALLLHKIGWKLMMSMIRVMRVKTDMLITMKSRTGRVLWPPKLYFLALFLSSWPFSTLGKLWRGGWYVEGPLWLTSQGTATSVSTPQLLLLNKIQRQRFFLYELLVGYHKYNASKILEKKITIHSFFQIITLMV